MGLILLERRFLTEDYVRGAKEKKKYVISRRDIVGMICFHALGLYRDSPYEGLADYGMDSHTTSFIKPFKTKRMRIAGHDCLVVFGERYMSLHDLLTKQVEEPQLAQADLYFAKPKVKIPKNQPMYPSSEGAEQNWSTRMDRFRAKVKEAEQKQSENLESLKTSFANSRFYLYKGNLYYFDGSDIHSEDEQKLLVKEDYFKRDKKFANLRKEMALFEKLSSGNVESREPIPQDVRFAVWRRDGGKCVSCGSNEKLEYDHIIPVSKGGSSTERNIQLLCEKCNREKSAKI